MTTTAPRLLLLLAVALGGCATDPVASDGDTSSEPDHSGSAGDATRGDPDTSPSDTAGGAGPDAGTATADSDAGDPADPDAATTSDVPDAPPLTDTATDDDAGTGGGDPDFPDGYLDPDYFPEITSTEPDPNAPGPDVVEVPTCSKQCDAVVSAGCEGSPASEEACAADCGPLESGVCGPLLQAVVDCRGADPDVTCHADGQPTVAGCEGEEAELAACLTADVPTCADACPAIVAADCPEGPADEAACLDDCTVAETECPQFVEPWVTCLALEPELTCAEAGTLHVDSCVPENTNFQLCLADAKVSCSDLCAALLEPACTEGPQSLTECSDACDGQAADCPEELDAWVDCAKTTFFACHPIDGVPLPVGCDEQIDALDACLKN